MRFSLARKVRRLSGLQLDICCGANKQSPAWFGIDIQPLPGVDLIWDVNRHPWPLPGACAVRAIASHVVEHIPKMVIDRGRTRWPFIEFMNEVWRLLVPGGEFAIAAPHGHSSGFLQDPTHVSSINEATFYYFDPETANGLLYSFYQPKPWRLKYVTYDPNANIEVVMVKREENGNERR